MDADRQKQLVLILARAFAANLSTPTLIADARGYLVYYNEAAEAVVQRRFSEAGEMPLEEWLEAFEPRSPTAAPLSLDQQPTQVALVQRRPAHLQYLVTSADGVERTIEVSAFPLFAHTDEFVGLIGFWWRI